MFAKLTAATLLAIAGVTLVAPAAHAREGAPTVTTATTSTASDGQEVRANVSTTYSVHNGTGQTLTVFRYGVTDGTFEGDRPVAGTKVYPGQTYRFAVTYWFLQDNEAYVAFQIDDTGSYLTATASPNWGVGLSGSSLGWNDGKYAITVGGTWNTDLTLTSASRTTHTVPASESQKQYETLKQLCADGSSATCTFTPKAKVLAWADPHLAGDILPNHGPTDQTYTYDWSNTTTTTSEWGIEASLSSSIADIVEASVAAHYNQSVSHSVETGGSLQIPVLAGHTLWLSYSAPVHRVTGDFTIKIGNDTWKLTDVYFDIPKADKQGGRLETHQKPIGDPSIPTGPYRLR